MSTMPTESNRTDECVCELCGEEFLSEIFVQRHFQDVHEGLSTCPLCDLGDVTPDELCIHVEYVHGEVNSMNAGMARGICHETVGNAGTMGNVSASLVREDRHECPVCALQVPKSLLNDHVNAHFDGSDQMPEATTPSYCGATPVSPRSSALKASLQLEERRLQERQKYEDQKQLEKPQDVYGLRDNSAYTKQTNHDLERDVMRGKMSSLEYHIAQNRQASPPILAGTSVDDGRTRTEGVLRRLREFASDASNSAAETWLCSDEVSHYGGDWGDRGWGCGYRNAQMLLSALAHHPLIGPALFEGRRHQMPSVVKIQQLIEAGWRKGFDPAGSEQLHNRLVHSRKWIGATEIFVLLSQFGVRTKLVDFHRPSGSKNTHPMLFQWLHRYFSDRSRQFKLPVYLQHQGHSRTVVGIERTKRAGGQFRLLIFDPSTSPQQLLRLTTGVGVNNHSLGLLRRTESAMAKPQYQLLFVEEGLMSPAELEASKNLTSTRIP